MRYPSSRKTTSFLTSRRLKEYKNLLPGSAANGGQTWLMLENAIF